MRSFNWTSVFALGLLVACGGVAPKDETVGSFVVDRIEVIQTESRPVSEDWGVPAERTFSLKACLQDRLLLEPLVDQHIEVKSFDESRELQTDAKGCVYWDESLKFDYFAPETFYSYKTDFAPARNKKDRLSVQLAVNPWREGESSLVDLRQESLGYETLSCGLGTCPSGILRAPDYVDKDRARLVVPVVNLQTVEKNYAASGGDLDAQITLAPQLERKTLGGKWIREDLRAGKFLFSYAIQEDVRGEKQGRALLAKGSARLAITNGVAQFSGALRVAALPKDNSVVRMSVELYPQDLPLSLGSFRGEVVVDDLIGNSTMALMQTAAGEEVAPTRISTASLRGSVDRTPFYFMPPRVVNLSVESLLEHERVPNAFRISIEACLRNRSGGDAPLRNQRFEVRLEGENLKTTSKEAMADDDGCLYFNDILSFDPFRPKRWLEARLVARGMDSPFKNVEGSYKLYFNPWLPEGIRVWDPRQGELPKVDEAELKPFKLLIDSVEYKPESRLIDPVAFAVEDYLNLQMKRRYQVQLDVLIDRGRALGAFVGNGANHDFRFYTPLSGRYRLRAYLATPADPVFESSPNTPERDEEVAALNPLQRARLQFVSGDESYYREDFVEVVDGRITSELEFALSFQRWPHIAGRAVLFLELAPVDAASSLKAEQIMLTFYPSAHGESAVFTRRNEVDKDLPALFDELASQHRLDQELESIPGINVKKEFLQAFNAVEVKGKSLIVTAMSKDQVAALVEDPYKNKRIASRFCTVPYRSYNYLNDCQMNPYGALRFERVSFVGVVEDYQAADYNYDEIKMSSEVFAEIRRDRTGSAGATGYVKGYVKAEGGFSILGNGAQAGVEAGVEGFATYQRGNGTNTRSREAVKFQKQFSVDQYDIRIKAKREDCLMVTTLKGASYRFLLCDSEPSGEAKWFSESWFFVTQLYPANDSVASDRRSSRFMPWTTAIRGKPRFDEFRDVIENRTRELHLEGSIWDSPYKSDIDIDKRVNQIFRRYYQSAGFAFDSSFPGVLVR